MLAYLPHGTVKTKTSTLSSLLLNENVSLLVTEIPQVSAGKGDSIFFFVSSAFIATQASGFENQPRTEVQRLVL